MMTTLPTVGIGCWEQGSKEDITEIQNCYCPNCKGTNADNKILPTKVPGFREIIIITVTCNDCGFRNSEVSFGGTIQPHGIIQTFRLHNAQDLNRQILKTNSATVKVPLLDLEIPPTTQQGVITTIEGLLDRVSKNLLQDQPDRLRFHDIDNFYRCQNVIDKIQQIIGRTEVDDDNNDEDDDYCGKDEANENNTDPSSLSFFFPFDIILDDPAGNASIENPFAPNSDLNIKIDKYDRTPNQDMLLGLQPSKAVIDDGYNKIQDDNPSHKNPNNTISKNKISIDEDISVNNMKGVGLGRHETIKIPTTCTSCHNVEAVTNVCVIDIPHFKEVIIMSLQCDDCGYKSTEIKGGGPIPKFGSKVILNATKPSDLEREVLKSETAGIQIPQLELELVEGGVGDGVYTTVEGLLTRMRKRLEEANPFGYGDSVVHQQHIEHSNNNGTATPPGSVNERYTKLLEMLKDMANGNILPFSLTISDPLANSFIGPIPEDAAELALQTKMEGGPQQKTCYDTYHDEGLIIETFERSDKQNEYLGLNDMKTEGYRNNNEYYGTDQMTDMGSSIIQNTIREKFRDTEDHPHPSGGINC